MKQYRLPALLLCLGLLLSLQGFAADRPGREVERIFFSRHFPGSVPEYFEVVIDSTGRVSYRETPEEESVDFAVSQEVTAKVFGLAAELDYFRAPIASKRKVAFTGEKVFRYQDGEGKGIESRFNYSRLPAARSLVQWFQKVSETERHLLELERVARFDRLGVNNALLQFQVSYDDGRVVAPEQFLPILRQIAGEKRYLQIARSRASSLAERIELNR